MAGDIYLQQTTTTAAMLSFTLNGTEQTDIEVHWSDQVLTQISITIVVMVVTLIGNVTLILTLARNKSTRKRRISVFLINLALGDLTVCVVTMTTEIIFVAFGEWVLGPVACKLAVYGQIVTLASSTFLLTAMSIDRYQVIVQPLRTLARRPKIWRKVTLAWILSFVFASPQLFIFVRVRVPKPDGSEVYKCLSRGYTEPEWQRKIYMTFLACYVLLVPTIIMTYCYTKILQTLWNRGSGGSHLRTRIEMRMSGRTDVVRSSKRKAVKLSLGVICGFLLCWTPYFLVSLIRIYSDYTIHLDTVLDFSEKMALVHSALNPLIYGFFNVKFNRGYPCFQQVKNRFASCCRFRELYNKQQQQQDSCMTIENHERKASLDKLHHDLHTRRDLDQSETSSLTVLQAADNDGRSTTIATTTTTNACLSKLTGGATSCHKRETIPLLDSK